MKKILFICLIVFGFSNFSFSQNTITAYGRNSTTISTDERGNSVTTINCDSFYANEICYRLQIGGPVIVKGISANRGTLTNYEDGKISSIKSGYIQKIEKGGDEVNNFTKITFIEK